MRLTGRYTYVGFGFGAIQAGLFLYEAFRSGNFGRLVVVEVVPEIVRAVRGADGCCEVNIAHADRIEAARVGPVEIYDPAAAADRERIVEAVAEAQEIGTAIPSVDLYATKGAASLHRVLAMGLGRKIERDGPRAVVYAAENNNRAAEILEELVLSEMTEDQRHGVRSRVQFLNTVIGKMSGSAGVVPAVGGSRDGRQDAGGTGPAGRTLAPVTPGTSRAFLVEAFNRILISRIGFPQDRHEAVPGPDAAGGGCATTEFQRGIAVFEEKDDLLPFEEAKLFGHNATHALAAYLGRFAGMARMADLRRAPGLMAFLRDAFVHESGAALIREYAGVDPLFTEAGYAAYADDLLDRMTNPYLMDTVERVGRDPARKLGWDDRLIGTMRLAISHGIEPRRYAIGAAAGFAALDPDTLDDPAALADRARALWRTDEPDAAELERVLSVLEDARAFLLQWRSTGFADLQTISLSPPGRGG